jgi:3-phenylpropionate/trans-cinnamate dioxygenase ferredoxin reductase subunit
MMRKVCKVTLNKDAFLANCGELLLDSALMNGVDLPHDCRSGICGACRVRLVEGKVFGGTEEGSDMIHACQARIVSDLKIVTEAVPEVVSLQGRVAQLDPLAPDVLGVSVELQKPLAYLPGQYCKLQFRGFPERCYSPSYPLEGAPDRGLVRFQIRRFPDGAVSSALGERIRTGHRVRLTGPFGHAFFRPGHRGRIVLVASGTGFAPMWSIAAAAMTEQPRQGSFSPSTWAQHSVASPCFRMSPSFPWCRSRRTSRRPFVRAGRPIFCHRCRRTMSCTPRARP